MKIFTRERFIGFVYVLIDVICLSIAFYFACLIRSNTLPFDVHVDNLFFDPVNPYRSLFLFWVLITVILNNAFGLYQTEREIYETIEVSKVIRASFFASLIAIVVIYLIKIEDFPRTIFILFSLFTTILFSAWRIVKRLFVLHLVSNGYNNFNILIIGAGKEGLSLAHEIDKRPRLGFKIVGFLDNHMQKTQGNQYKILGKVEDFNTIAQREFIHKVFVTNHYDSEIFGQLLAQAKQLGIAVRVVPYGYEFMSGDFQKYNIGIIPILEYSQINFGRKQAGKRVFDFIMSLLLIMILMPVYIVLSILVKLDSPGPVFYYSNRYGRRGQTFHMFKFRSMVTNAEELLKDYQELNEADGPIFKMKKDPRITRLGRILRKFSLDELPQLFNVLRGDMSLVGPRPLPIAQIEREDLKQLKRLEVRPGITGLWQVRGRSDISFSRMLEWDVWYINNWSLWLDLNILFQTVPVVFKGQGAY
jgi:exopolysaccharide biosynthesis polyprenyl glycosylphosphotransferase